MGTDINIVVILANGTGNRFGSDIPKQFHIINGKMVIEYVIEAIERSATEKIVIATDPYSYSTYFDEIQNNPKVDLITGGNTRNESLKCALEYIHNNYSCKKMIVCDAVRPLITADLLDKYFTFLDYYSAVVTAQKITDSLGCLDFQEVDRERYYLMQSPEGFDFQLLYSCFDSKSSLTEVTQQLPKNSKIKLFFDFKNNFKLTYPEDTKYLQILLQNNLQ